jgi:hypothetical protein
VIQVHQDYQRERHLGFPKSYSRTRFVFGNPTTPNFSRSMTRSKSSCRLAACSVPSNRSSTSLRTFQTKSILSWRATALQLGDYISVIKHFSQGAERVAKPQFNISLTLNGRHVGNIFYNGIIVTRPDGGLRLPSTAKGRSMPYSHQCNAFGSTSVEELEKIASPISIDLAFGLVCGRTGKFEWQT